jgi:hypothetical protein
MEKKTKNRVLINSLLVVVLVVGTNLFTFYFEEFKFSELVAEKNMFYIWGTSGSPWPWNAIGAKIYTEDELLNAPE